MSEDQIAELFDIELVRYWKLDSAGNSIEKKVELDIPVIEVSIYGDSQCYWFE